MVQNGAKLRAERGKEESSCESPEDFSTQPIGGYEPSLSEGGGEERG